MWQITIFIKQSWNHGYIFQGPNNQPGIYCIIPALILAVKCLKKGQTRSKNTFKEKE